MNNTYIFDACTLIAFFNSEDGYDKVKDLLGEKENKIYMHAVNLCEIYYGFYKAKGKENAELLLTETMALPVIFVEDVSVEFIKLAGKYKASYRISLADAFVLALAEKERGQIVTSDRNEFEPVAQKEKSLKILWIR